MSIHFPETSQNVSTSPHCSELRSNHQKKSSARLKLLRIVSKRHTTPLIASFHYAFHPNRSESSQNCPYSFPVFRISFKTSTNCLQSPQNFRISFQNFDKLLSAFLIGHKFITTCPQIVAKPHKESQSSQMALISSQIGVNHRRMPSTHRIIATNLLRDVTERLNSRSHVLKSTPIVTNGHESPKMSRQRTF